MNRVLPFVMAGVGLVIVLIILVASPTFWKPIPATPSYDPSTPNGNLTDAQLIEKAKTIPVVELFVSKYPNAKVKILHPWEMRHNPPVTGVRFIEERQIVGDKEGVVRSFEAHIGFYNYDNQTGAVNLLCYHFGADPWPQPLVSPDNHTDYILNQRCFS